MNKLMINKETKKRTNLQGFEDQSCQPIFVIHLGQCHMGEHLRPWFGHPERRT